MSEQGGLVLTCIALEIDQGPWTCLPCCISEDLAAYRRPDNSRIRISDVTLVQVGADIHKAQQG